MTMKKRYLTSDYANDEQKARSKSKVHHKFRLSSSSRNRSLDQFWYQVWVVALWVKVSFSTCLQVFTVNENSMFLCCNTPNNIQKARTREV